MDWNLPRHLQGFFESVAQGKTEIYNEFSFQHELGCYLRSVMPEEVKVQFERPSWFFGIRPKLLKKGQHPEQMYKACQDIRFLEQLCENGFERGYFVMVADDPLFYSGSVAGIYCHFRGSVPLAGTIQKPTGLRDTNVALQGSYGV